MLIRDVVGDGAMGLRLHRIGWATRGVLRRDRADARGSAAAVPRARFLLDGSQQASRVAPHTFRQAYLAYVAWAGRVEPFALARTGTRLPD